MPAAHRRRRSGDVAIAIRAGSSHTRWWIQVTGLSRQARTPVAAKPARTSPAARRTVQAHAASTAATHVSHRSWFGWPEFSRVTRPISDWLDTYGRAPTRWVSQTALAK